MRGTMGSATTDASSVRLLSAGLCVEKTKLQRSSVATVISLVLAMGMAACGGGGGGSSAPPPSTPNPAPSTNSAPIVEAGTAQSLELPQDTAQLQGSATDDGPASSLTYTWSTESAPAGTSVVFGSANAASTTARFPSDGSYQLKLTVSDGTNSTSDIVAVNVSPAVYPAADPGTFPHGWTTVAPADVKMDAAKLDQARDYALTGGGSGVIVRRGRLVYSWGNIDTRFDVKSTTKSIGGIALGLALEDGRVTLNGKATSYLPTVGYQPPYPPPAEPHPQNKCKQTPAQNLVWIPDITVLQLATHTAGFEKPGCYGSLDYQPGTTWLYSDGGLNWLADVLTAAYGQDLRTVLHTRVFSRLGITVVNVDGGNDLSWRDNDLRPDQPTNRELASGINVNTNAMGRIGLLFLRRGVWGNERILSESFIDRVRTPAPEIANATIAPATDGGQFVGATTNYSVLWWTNATGMLANVPRDAYWAWGKGESLIVVIPSLDLVIARAGNTGDNNNTPPAWRPDWDGNYAILDPFLTPIVQSVTP